MPSKHWCVPTEPVPIRGHGHKCLIQAYNNVDEALSGDRMGRELSRLGVPQEVGDELDEDTSPWVWQGLAG